ncbi:hypothetical protein Tco_1110149 [Tanacetum coccineum]|uniref:Uncharacterized protein n=1 Tax=Tanacetum coccineum TaxID=301880 RepID=A0ABQ5IJ72_9ASTR
MLVPSGGDLILYQAYGNLYAMTEKPICLRTSKSQVLGYLMRYLAFGRHLEEIHVTWAHLEKKRTRLWTYTNISQDYVLSGWRRPQDTRDAVTIHPTTVSQHLPTASARTTHPNIKNILFHDGKSLTTTASRNKDGISVKKEIEWTRQTKGSGYDPGYQKVALSKKVDAKSREVCWWKRIRE